MSFEGKSQEEIGKWTEYCLKKENGPRASSAPALELNTIIFKHVYCRAFSDLLGKFLVPMKLGKKIVILGKNMTILGKNSAFFNKIGKVYLLNWDFSANWECSTSIGNFFSQLGKNLVPETGPSFV